MSPNARVFDGLYQLDLHTRIWTKIQTGETKPPKCYEFMLNALSGSQLVFHGSRKIHDFPTICTWILDLPSRTWKRYKGCVLSPVVRHAGTSGLNNDVITIGGINF